jgi:hypothetical protein
MKQRMLIARKSFTYANRSLKAGDSFTAMNDKDVMILCGLGNASADKDEQDDSVTEPAKTLKLSTYRRRDMRAEQS